MHVTTVSSDSEVGEEQSDDDGGTGDANKATALEEELKEC